MIYRDIPGGMGGIYEEVLRGTQPLLPIITPRNLHDLIFQNRVIEGNRGNTEEFLHMIAIAHASLREFEVLVACEAESIDMEIALLQSVIALDRAYQCIHHRTYKAA